MDTQHLRIIANPFILKKSKEKIKSEYIKKIEKNDLLYRYLELKYKDIYINPNLFYEIMEKIEESMEKYQIEMVVKYLVDNVSDNVSDNLSDNLLDNVPDSGT